VKAFGVYGEVWRGSGFKMEGEGVQGVGLDPFHADDTVHLCLEQLPQLIPDLLLLIISHDGSLGEFLN